MRITVETGLLGLHTDIPEGRPAPKRIFKLERTVLDKFGIQAAIGSVIDIFKKIPYMVDWIGAPVFCTSILNSLLCAIKPTTPMLNRHRAMAFFILFVIGMCFSVNTKII